MKRNKKLISIALILIAITSLFSCKGKLPPKAALSAAIAQNLLYKNVSQHTEITINTTDADKASNSSELNPIIKEFYKNIHIINGAKIEATIFSDIEKQSYFAKSNLEYSGAKMDFEFLLNPKQFAFKVPFKSKYIVATNEDFKSDTIGTELSNFFTQSSKTSELPKKMFENMLSLIDDANITDTDNVEFTDFKGNKTKIREIKLKLQNKNLLDLALNSLDLMLNDTDFVEKFNTTVEESNKLNPNATVDPKKAIDDIKWQVVDIKNKKLSINKYLSENFNFDNSQITLGLSKDNKLVKIDIDLNIISILPQSDNSASNKIETKISIKNQLFDINKTKVNEIKFDKENSMSIKDIR